MDGAMGTELQRPGRTIGSTGWIETTLGAPEEVSAIHRSYAEAGARLHIANTFATGRHVLAAAGVEDQFDRLNRNAVRLCREAIGSAGTTPQWIAGSVSTYVIGSDRNGLPPLPLLQDNVRAQCAVLADEGCALIALEMLFDVETSISMMSAAAETGLPVMVGLTCIAGPDGNPHLRGASRGQTGAALESALPDILSGTNDAVPWILAIMHSDLDVTNRAFEVAAKHWDGPLAIYPNSGALMPPDCWDFDAVCTPEVFVEHARSWAAGGASIIGGCCGIGPTHIQAIGEELGG